jgi:hypothetical protein
MLIRGKSTNFCLHRLFVSHLLLLVHKALRVLLPRTMPGAMDSMKGAIYAACVLSGKEAGEGEEAVTVRTICYPTAQSMTCDRCDTGGPGVLCAHRRVVAVAVTAGA